MIVPFIPSYQEVQVATVNCASFPNFECMPEVRRKLRSVSGADAGIAWVIELKVCIDLAVP